MPKSSNSYLRGNKLLSLSLRFGENSQILNQQIKTKPVDLVAVKEDSHALLDKDEELLFFDGLHVHQSGQIREHLDAGQNKDSLFRSIDDEIDVGKPLIVTIGCSFTAGSGLPEEFSWPKLIEHDAAQQVLNLGVAGSSIVFQSHRAIHSLARMREITPVKLYALFPDLERMFAFRPNDAKMFTPEHIMWHRGAYELSFRSDKTNDGKVLPNQIRVKEYVIEDYIGAKHTIPSELTVFNSFLAVETLYNVCTIAGIEFKFTTWSQTQIADWDSLCHPCFVAPRSLHPVDEPYKWRSNVGSHSNSSKQWSKTNGSRWRPWHIFGIHGERICEHEPQNKKQEEFWDIAADLAHPGLHDQIHFAEHFTQKRMSNESLSLVGRDAR